MATGLLLELGLLVLGCLVWRRLARNSRFLLWRVLLEKYPARADICLEVHPEALEVFIVDNLVAGEQPIRLSQCAVVIGERGLHLTQSEDPRCEVGYAFKRRFLFIPWCRLRPKENPTCLEVLGSGDVLMLRGVVANPLSLRPSFRPGRPLFCLFRSDSLAG